MVRQGDRDGLMVVCLWSQAFIQHKGQMSSRGTYEEEVARVEAVAVQGHGPVAEEQVDELGDELLGVLVRAVHVVAARDDKRQVERPGTHTTIGQRQGRARWTDKFIGKSGRAHGRSGAIAQALFIEKMAYLSLFVKQKAYL